MSKFVDDIVKDIRTNPTSWVKGKMKDDIKKDNMQIVLFGNTRVASIIDIEIDNLPMKTTYFDRWKLESVVKWWWKNINLEHLK